MSAKEQFEKIIGHELYGHPEFYELLLKMADVHSSKNHDYSGPGTFALDLKAGDRIGISPFKSVVLRLQQKWSRLEQFVRTGELKVADEKIEDTLLDEANYALLAILLRREQKAQEVVSARAVDITDASGKVIGIKLEAPHA